MIKGINLSQTLQSWRKYTQDYAHLQVALDAGANFFRVGMAKNPWDENRETLITGLGYREHLKEVVNRIKASGAEVMIAAMSYEDFNTMSMRIRGDLIVSPALQDAWIATYKEAVQELQPEYVEMMNEPPPAHRSGTGLTDPQLFARYHPFMEKSASEYLDAKSDVKIAVMSQPFWRMAPIAARPLSVPAIYTFHEYCTVNNPNKQPIVDALAMGDLEEAERLWERLIFDSGVLHPDMNGEGIGVGRVIDAGLPVMCTECGTTLPTEDRREWMKIHYDMMEEHRIGWSHHSLNTNAGGIHNYGILSGEGGFNEIGEHWAENLTQPPDPEEPIPEVPEFEGYKVVGYFKDNGEPVWFLRKEV